MFGNHGLCGLLKEGGHGKSPKCLGRNLGDLGEFCKGLNMPVKVLGRAYYDIPGITDQNTLAEFWNHPTPPDKELFHAYRMYHLNVTQINGNFYSQVFFPNKSTSDSSTPTT